MTRRLILRILAVVVLMFVLCSSAVLAQGRSDQGFERVKQVQERNTERLMALKDVEGTAVGVDDSDQLTLQVFTAGPGVRGIPRSIEGVPVEVIETGKITALSPGGQPGKPEKTPSTQTNPTLRFDPVPIGVSTGNAGECSAGTIGCWVTDGTSIYALSNNHVYALENNAAIGSTVLQPGRYDTTCTLISTNKIGVLSNFTRIDFTPGANNVVDAAIAKWLPASRSGYITSTPANGYGTPKSSPASATVGLLVQKYGRTSSLTKGYVYGINATVNVSYSTGTAKFVKQILVYGNRSAFIKAGDSGSLLVTQAGNYPVGLLFAGDSSGKWAWANPISDVLQQLGNVGIMGQ
jgi:hypothetical protein